MADSSAIAARLNARLGLGKNTERPRALSDSAPSTESISPVPAGQLVHSQRSTTSSRTPGRVNEGTVPFRAAGLVRCVCGFFRMNLGGPHAPRWERGLLVDCQGKAVQ